jgi:hypothetical protein
VVTEGSAGHLFPFDTLWAVVNEQEGPAELVVPVLEGFECDGQFFCTVYTRRLRRQ